MERPFISLKAVALWQQTLISRALLSIFFGVPSKLDLAPDSPHRTPTERDAPLLETPSSISQSPWQMSPLPGPLTGSLWREISVSKVLFYITFGVPNKRAPPVSPHRAPTDRERESERVPPLSETQAIRLAKSLVNEPNTGCPTEPTYREMPVSRTYFT